MDELRTLEALAASMGVYTHYTDGLGQQVTVAPETLVRTCASLGASIERPADAAEALRALEAERQRDRLPPVIVAWDGVLPTIALPGTGPFLSLIHISEPTRRNQSSRMPSSA